MEKANDIPRATIRSPADMNISYGRVHVQSDHSLNLEEAVVALECVSRENSWEELACVVG